MLTNGEDDASIHFVRLLDKDRIFNIISFPDIWERAVGGDGCKDSFGVDIDNRNAWWEMCKEGRTLGIMHLNQLGGSTVIYHPYLRKKERHLCREMIASFFKWFLHGMDVTINKVICLIPTKYKKVYNFAIKSGFR